MKKFVFLFVGLILLGSSCSNDEPETGLSLKEKLIGNWVEVLPCDSCRVFTFSQNDTLYQKNISEDTTYSLCFQVITEDSIQVTRNWEIEQSKKTTKHRVIFSSSDTLLIKQFLGVDFGITGFEDITLTKTD